ncbi:hypothetical protein FIBSPDRAFT_969316, partial [Athelia psychrophila]
PSGNSSVLEIITTPSSELTVNPNFLLDFQAWPLNIDLGINPHTDNTFEILHTYLLGNDKYIWHDTNKGWDKKKEEKFAVRLQSSSTDGLTLPPVRAHYIAQYKNSLIGKHFKALQQLIVFQLHDNMCSDIHLQLWKATGELGALLWYHEIKNMDLYLADLDILVNNLLDIWAILDPRRILTKFKLHVLAHIKEDIRRHGPAILYSTEIFECWNAIFRMCSVLSNHLAPSHDIAVTLADMERFKHQVSGGWWKNEAGTYVQAGQGIRSFMEGNKQLQRRLGWVDSAAVKAGTVKQLSRKKRQLATARELIGPLWSPNLQGIDGDSEYVLCKHLISRSHDVCKPGSWVFFRSETSVVPGRIFKILSPLRSEGEAGGSFVVLDVFRVEDNNDLRLNMPILSRAGQVLIAQPKDILFIFNAQHDCFAGHCKIVEGDQPVMQERQEIDRRQKCVAHTNDDRYLLNTHALHNSALIRETLPRSLVTPKPYLAETKNGGKAVRIDLA